MLSITRYPGEVYIDMCTTGLPVKDNQLRKFSMELTDVCSSRNRRSIDDRTTDLFMDCDPDTNPDPDAEKATRSCPRD